MSIIVKTLDVFVQTVYLDEIIHKQVFLLYRDTIYFLMFFRKSEELIKESLPKINNELFHLFGWLLFTFARDHFSCQHDYESNSFVWIASYSLFLAICPNAVEYPNEKSNGK